MDQQRSPAEHPPREGEIRGEALTIAPAEVVDAIFSALDRSVATITVDCQVIGDTLRSLDEALGAISGGGDGQSWSGFGVVGLPIMGAVRAVRGVAAQYVRQQTGASLNDWAAFVTSSTQTFEAYVRLLEDVTALATAHRGHADRAVRHQDLDVLADVRWQTQAWKQVLDRVTQLGQVVDAVLQVDIGQDDVPQAGDEEPARLSGAFKRRLQEAQTRTFDKSADLREWVLRPFVEIRDGVMQLPRQVEHLAHEIALFEILLDAGIAEMRALHGEISEAEARAVGMRVAATVVLPELARHLTEERGRAATLEANIDRLRSARADGRVGERAYAVLVDEYEEALAICRARLARLEASADAWHRDGPPMLDACAERVRLQLEVLAARGIAEQVDASVERRTLLERELERLAEVRTSLAAM